MFRALFTAATGMQAQQTNLDTIANNLSNSSTAGFQSRRMQFQDLIYQSTVMPGRGRLAADHGGDGPADRTGCALVGVGDHPVARRLESDRGIRSTWRSKARDFFRYCCRPGKSPTRAAAPSIRMRKAIW